MADRKRERDPMPMGDLVRLLVTGRGWGEKMSAGRLRDLWPQIVGETVAARTEPLQLSRGVLTIAAEGAWATELTLRAAAVAARANDCLGEDMVKEVRIAGHGGRRRPE